ncbi:UNVERIFIED_CONTAM: F-box protein [Sesamum angustifolium]|uniref:F-box protein n=1 Tax=Sesamum angustifolium TaxID=2727405 RepID=A0AAW2MUA6_9LAMI
MVKVGKRKGSGDCEDGSEERFLIFMMNNAGDRLVAALSLSRYQNVKHINLEFARDIEDKHLEIVKSKCGQSVKNLEVLNLNGCQKISDLGIEFITYNCSKLKVFSIYWNVRVSDLSIRKLVKNCKLVVDLNLSGCKNITDESLKLIAESYQGLQLLNLTRCIKLTDGGLQMILLKCSSLQSLNLYALSSFTDVAYKKISFLIHLRFLDLCGAQPVWNSWGYRQELGGTFKLLFKYNYNPGCQWLYWHKGT